MNRTTDKDLIEAKTRLTNAKAEQAEIKLAVMKKEYLPVSEVNKQWQEQAGRVKQRLLALPTRLAGMWGGLTLMSTDIERQMTKLMNEALNELADMPVIEEPEISDD